MKQTPLKPPRVPLTRRLLLRSQEGSLLRSFFYALMIGFAGIYFVRWSQGLPIQYEDWLLIPAIFVAMYLIHLLLILIRFHGDQALITGSFFLMGLGVLVQYRYGFVNKNAFTDWHSAGYPAGVLAMITIIIIFRYCGCEWLRAVHWVAFFGVIGLELYLLTYGIHFRGAHFAPGHLTPAEFLKPLMLLLIAGYLTRFSDDLGRGKFMFPYPGFRAMLWMAFYFLPTLGLLVLLHDIGVLLIIFVVFCLLLYLTTGRSGYLILLVGSCIAVAAVLIQYMPYWHNRLIAWKDPFAVATNQGFQTVQSLMALFDGGLIGRGLGMGQPERIPIVETDFVYAGLGEEIGFLGCMVILVFFIVFFHRGIKIGMSRPTHFQALFSTGAILFIGVQTLINISGVVNLLPITGITLPFVSKGGSSLVTTLIFVGIVVGLSENEDDS